MNLILFGFKGCGKTHFGKLLAQKMHRRFLDTDDLIAELFAKKTGQHTLVREIYIQLGKESFRALEKEAIYALRSVKNGVIALGGGAVLDPENVELLQKIGCLVYLSTSAETLQKRIWKDGKTPAILESDDPQASFLEMYQERRPVYESIPAAKIDCDALDEAGVLAALQSLLVLQDPPNGF
jgi:shikimate kinase